MTKEDYIKEFIKQGYVVRFEYAGDSVSLFISDDTDVVSKIMSTIGVMEDVDMLSLVFDMLNDGIEPLIENDYIN